ncbi:hypothetical protein BDZ91DRAFT_289546 [Kalaharituber pfeilii]|nr:hypothetical protein BDZ91DRAFT_289546 [Kalaharituber pfeilii]
MVGGRVKGVWGGVVKLVWLDYCGLLFLCDICLPFFSIVNYYYGFFVLLSFLVSTFFFFLFLFFCNWCVYQTICFCEVATWFVNKLQKNRFLDHDVSSLCSWFTYLCPRRVPKH